MLCFLGVDPRGKRQKGNKKETLRYSAHEFPPTHGHKSFSVMSRILTTSPGIATQFLSCEAAIENTEHTQCTCGQQLFKKPRRRRIFGRPSRLYMTYYAAV